MKTAQEILASLSPVPRDPVAHPFTSDEVRKITADELLSDDDFGILRAYATEIGLRASPPWWAENYLSDPHQLKEYKAWQSSLADRPASAGVWMREANIFSKEEAYRTERVARFRERLTREEALLEAATTARIHFDRLLQATPEAKESSRLLNLYWPEKEKITKRKPGTPDSGK